MTHTRTLSDLSDTDLAALRALWQRQAANTTATPEARDQARHQAGLYERELARRQEAQREAS